MQTRPPRDLGNLLYLYEPQFGYSYGFFEECCMNDMNELC